MTEALLNGKPAAGVTLEQFCVVAAFERVMGLTSAEANVLRAMRQNEAAEKLEANLRHLEKQRAEYLRDCQSRLVIAQAGVIPDIGGKTH